MYLSFLCTCMCRQIKGRRFVNEFLSNVIIAWYKGCSAKTVCTNRNGPCMSQGLHLVNVQNKISGIDLRWWFFYLENYIYNEKSINTLYKHTHGHKQLHIHTFHGISLNKIKVIYIKYIDKLQLQGKRKFTTTTYPQLCTYKIHEYLINRWYVNR